MPFFKVFAPPSSLCTVVREVQVYHIQWGKEDNLPEPFITCLANTEQNLYFFPGDPLKVIPAPFVEIPSPAAVITGPKTKPVGLLFGKNHLMIKVAFHPTGTYRLLGIDMQKVVNNGLEAAGYWGPGIMDTTKELQDTDSYELMSRIVFAFLEKTIERNCREEEPIDLVAIRMLEPQSAHSIQEWASMACLSIRQFERNFITRVGISPKLFLRIVRFEYAMNLKRDKPGTPWTEVALECFYTDLSHFQREFKAFAEFPPASFYLRPTSGHSGFPTG